jgi:hypothetical protein
MTIAALRTRSARRAATAAKRRETRPSQYKGEAMSRDIAAPRPGLSATEITDVLYRLMTDVAESSSKGPCRY